MLRVLIDFIPLILTIYALVDCIQTPDDQVRVLPRWGWLLLILVPIIGATVWFLAGRARGGAPGQRVAWPTGPLTGAPDQPRPTRRVVAPDDDPEFLSQLGRSNSEHDALLEEWERDLRRREGELRDESPDAGPGEPGDEPDAGGSSKPRP
jgi:Phospholipase_D-nuclease N-terminal